MNRPVRTALFWLHLAGGVAAGVLIFSLSVSGAALGFERQLLAWGERLADDAAGRPALEMLLPTLAGHSSAAESLRITMDREGAYPITVREGRGPTSFYHGVDVTPMDDPAPRLRAALAALRGYHRWLTLQDQARDQARAVLGAANLIFFGLLLTGSVLWWPRRLRWPWLRQQLTWSPRPPTPKARDLRLHHMLGAWAWVPLVVICASGTVFYYGWANDAVYRLAGEVPPARTSSVEAAEVLPSAQASLTPFAGAPLEAWIHDAVPGWRRLTVTLGASPEGTLSFSVDESEGGRPQAVSTLTLTAAGASELAPFESLSPGQRARRWVRFLHTGEALGLGGQFVATLASLAAAVLAYSGLALSYRRLILTPLRRRAARASSRPNHPSS